VKIFLKIIKWTLLTILTVVIVGFLYLYFIYFGQPDYTSTAQAINDNEWHMVSLPGETSCSDGSEYAIYIRKGSSNNLILHFSGGGACWDDPTCSSPITIFGALTSGNPKELNMFYYPSLTRLLPGIISGIFDNDSSTNPFSDWNVVYIPYCTGDLHVGNTVATYTSESGPIEIHHRGRSNSLAAIHWVKDNFSEPQKLIVSGESAGAYGSAFWAPYIATQFENSSVYQVSDGALLTSTRWPELMDTVWQAESQKFLHFTVSNDVYEDALLKRTDSTERPIKHLHSNTLYDEVLPKFSAALNHVSTNTNAFIDQWSHDMRTSMLRLANSGIDYHYFISDCNYNTETHSTPHTLLGNGGFNSCPSGRMTLNEWLKKNIIDDEPVSVGSELLQQN